MATRRKILKWLPVLGLLTVTAQQNRPHFDPERDQIVIYKQRTKGVSQRLTLTSGAPVEYGDTSSLNQRLIYNNYLMESLTGIVRERIPPRVVHSKGTGAFGYLEVTHNVTQYTKADFLNKIGKKTPVAVRFSSGSSDTSGSDSLRILRGFAVKFYTRQGNFDLVGLNVPISAFKDPLVLPSLAHSIGRNPATHISDPTVMWDFILLHPESFFLFSKTFANQGLPKGYRHMPGYGVHTFQVHNKHGDIYLVRFYFTPDAGEESITTEEGMKLNSQDPDSFTRDLYEAIGCGKKVSWTFSMQVMTVEQAKNLDIDVFDITQEIPFEKVPLTEVGKLVLNRNPDNHFAEVEQLALCPCNLVPGIDGGVDTAYQARMVIYRDAQHYRLGVNHNNIEVNCPFRTETHTYNRDGVPPVRDNGGGSPNYYKNSFNGPEPYYDMNRTKLLKIFEKKPNNFEQVCQSYVDMSGEEKKNHDSNLVDSLGPVSSLTRENVVQLLTKICPEMGENVKKSLMAFARQSVCDIQFD